MIAAAFRTGERQLHKNGQRTAKYRIRGRQKIGQEVSRIHPDRRMIQWKGPTLLSEPGGIEKKRRKMGELAAKC